MGYCMMAAVLAWLMGLAGQAHAQTALKVCAHPDRPCTSAEKTFAPYELTFKLPDTLEPNKEYKTAPFQAIILKTFLKFEAGGEECDGGEFSTTIEKQRAEAQKFFPDRKVFAAHQCPDMGAVLYQIKGQPYNVFFIAVYGGATLAEARQVLAQVKGKFSRPTVKEMQAVYTKLAE